MKINIIGLGTAGLASEIFLAKQGHQVTVYEACSELKPVGAGLLLQPTGLAILEKLRLGEQISQRGSRIDSLIGHTLNQRKVLDLHYKDLKPNSFGVGIHRATLFDSLFEKFQQLKITLVAGTSISHYQNKLDQVEIYHEENLIDTSDLLIVANGTRSTLRHQSPYFRSDKQYPWGAIWAVTKRPDAIEPNILQQKYQLAHSLLGLLPTGLLPDSKQPLVSLFWSLAVNNWAGIEKFNLDAWKNKVATQWPLAQDVLEQIINKNQLAFATYCDVKMKKWHHENTIFIGDAAHGMSPQLGQGANLALIDAFVLAQSLKQTNSIEHAFHQYHAIRKNHLIFYQFMSRCLTPFYQSNSRVLGMIKDYLSYPSAKIPLLRKQMLKTLSGQMLYPKE